MGRDYAFVRMAWPIAPDHLDLETIAIGNVRDGSSLLRATLTWKVRPSISVYAVQTEFVAGSRTELDYVQVRRMTDLGVRIYF